MFTASIFRLPSLDIKVKFANFSSSDTKEIFLSINPLLFHPMLKTIYLPPLPLLKRILMCSFSQLARVYEQQSSMFHPTRKIDMYSKLPTSGRQYYNWLFLNRIGKVNIISGRYAESIENCTSADFHFCSLITAGRLKTRNSADFTII